MRAARLAAGVSTRQLAGLLAQRGVAVTHATIANYERGRTIPSLSLVAKLSEVYGRPINWFLQSGPILTDIHYRAPKSVPACTKRQFEAEAEARRWLEAYMKVEEAIEARLHRTVTPLELPAQISGQGAAEFLRKHLGIGDAPLDSVITLLESFRIYVIEVETDSRIDAFAGRFGDAKVVVLNANYPNDRVRLNAAHELGHHLFEDCCTAPGASDEIETRTFDFGSHLLLPESQLSKALAPRSLIKLVETKELFGISLAAIIYRAKKANLIASKTYQRLWAQFTRYGWRKTEPGTVREDRPKRFERLLESAVLTGRISWAKASRVTCISEGDLRGRVVAATRRRP